MRTKGILEEKDFDWLHQVKCRVAANESAPADVLRYLAEDGDEEICFCVAGNPNTPLEVLRGFLEGSGSSSELKKLLRAKTAANRALPVDMIEELAHSEESRIRHAVARNPSTPKAVLWSLAQDESAFVRSCIARNTEAPASVLRDLSFDENTNVRRAVASNRSSPSDVLERLSFDENDEVRARVALNPSASPEAIDAIFTNPPKVVARSLPRLVRSEYKSCARILALLDSECPPLRCEEC